MSPRTAFPTFATAARAIARGRALAAAGADIIDVGGESTRPGSDPVPEELELDRVLPVIGALAGDGLVVSVDTRRPAVMRAAVAAGARIVNDVSALGAPGAVQAVAETGASAVLMHMQGSPATMQAAPRYDHAPWEVYRFLHGRVAACVAAGIGRERLAVDPGIGFGKDCGHNVALLDGFALLHGTGCAVMAGVSRKSFIGRLDGGAAPAARLPGTLAATVQAADRGVQLHRVHDVAEARQALAVWRAVALAG
jgi:dihydropteroate synthase